MLDAARLEEAVSAWLTDASGARADGYLTASSQPAKQSSAVRTHVRSERICCWRGGDTRSCSYRSSLRIGKPRVFSSATGGRCSSSSRASGPSAAHAFSVRFSSQRAVGAGCHHCSPTSSEPLGRASSGSAALTPSQRLARGQGADGDPMAPSAQTWLNPQHRLLRGCSVETYLPARLFTSNDSPPSRGGPSRATYSGRSCRLFRTAGTVGWIKCWTHWLSWFAIEQASLDGGCWGLASLFYLLRTIWRMLCFAGRPTLPRGPLLALQSKGGPQLYSPVSRSWTSSSSGAMMCGTLDLLAGTLAVLRRYTATRMLQRPRRVPREKGGETGELVKPSDTISATLFASCCTRWVLRARTPFSQHVKHSLLATERAGRASTRLFPLPLPFSRLLLPAAEWGPDCSHRRGRSSQRCSASSLLLRRTSSLGVETACFSGRSWEHHLECSGHLPEKCVRQSGRHASLAVVQVLPRKQICRI